MGFVDSLTHTTVHKMFLLGIGVLYVKAQEKDVNLFAFLSPLSAYVWILMILGGVSVSIVMYLIARYICDMISDLPVHCEFL